MNIKKTFVLPLLAAVVLPFVLVVPTFAHSAYLPADNSGAACKPVVQISFRNLNFFLDALRLEVSPCAIAALQHRDDITVQTDTTIPDNSITDQTLKTVTPAIKQGLLWRINDLLQVQQSCPARSISLSSPIYPFLGPITIDIFIRNMLPSVLFTNFGVWLFP